MSKARGHEFTTEEITELMRFEQVDKDRQKIYNRYRKGEHVEDIAYEYGVSTTTIRKVLRSFGDRFYQAHHERKLRRLGEIA